MVRPSYGRYTDGTNTPTEIVASSEGLEKVGIMIDTAHTSLIAKGTVMGRVTATGLYRPYSDGDSPAGVGVARGILVDDFDPTISTDQADLRMAASMYIRGTFYSAALTGMDANGLADLGARTHLDSGGTAMLTII